MYPSQPNTTLIQIDNPPNKGSVPQVNTNEFAPLEADFSIGKSRCTHVNGVPTFQQPGRSNLLNRNEFLLVTELFSEDFLNMLITQQPKITRDCHAKIITGENFNIDQVLTKSVQVRPRSDDYAVLVFKLHDEGSSGLFHLYMCKYAGLCQRVNNGISKFLDHMRTHTRERPYKCTISGCIASFTQKTNIKQHIKEVHMKVEPYICFHCPRTFTKKFNRDTHSKRCIKKSPETRSLYVAAVYESKK
jgi:hypothetical protein